MAYYLTSVQPLGQLLKSALQHYKQAFKASLYFILIIVLLENATFVLRYLPNSSFIVIYLLALSLLSIYLWCCALYSTHRVLLDMPLGFMAVLRDVATRLVSITLFVTLYFGFFVLTLFWMSFLNHRIFGVAVSPMMLWWLDLFLVGLPLLFFLLLFSLTIPVIIVEDLPVHRALARSAKMVWLSHLKPALILYGGMIIFFYMITPSTRHMMWLYQHHLKLVFDLIAYLLIGPLLVSYALVLVHNLDLMLRARALRDAGTRRVD